MAQQRRAGQGDEGADSTRLHALTWNLFHGRDFPPNETLRGTLRSRLFRVTEDDGTYVQVNRRLARKFEELVAAAGWEVCLLQEVPPGWRRLLERTSGGTALRTFTSRNQLRPLTTLLGLWSPDLIASWEGGSNMILVRGGWEPVPGSVRVLRLNPRPARGRRERRRMTFVRLRSGGERVEVCVGNLHASTGREHAERDVRRAAEAAVAWAGADPLLLGGDFNIRPSSSPLFDELEQRYGLDTRTGGPDGPEAIDHLLTRGLEPIVWPTPWSDRRRDLAVRHRGAARMLRLSDHAPVDGVFGVPLA